MVRTRSCASSAGVISTNRSCTGDYVRRYVPELGDVKGGEVHRPWNLSGVDYPRPLEGVEPVKWLD
jgi:deoxyribodipyrimidine photolyase